MHKISFVKTAIAAFSLSIAIFAQSQDEQVSTNANSNSASGTQRTEAVDGDFILKAKTRKGSYEEMNDVFRFQILQDQNFKAELKTQNDEWGSGFPEWTSDSTRFQFSTANGVEDALGKASAATPKNQTERIEVKNQDVAKEAELVACRYILAIHAYSPNYKIPATGETSKCGHVWISIYNLAKDGEETTYGLWPDGTDETNEYQTVWGSCLLKDYEQKELQCEAEYSHYYLLSESEYGLFIKDVLSQSMPGIQKKNFCYYWALIGSNCATYACAATNLTTKDPISPVIDSPKEVIKSINNEESKAGTGTSREHPLYDQTFYRGK